MKRGFIMKVTIYDVAKKAGVSIATVSKVINNTGSMRDSTRKRVLDTMKKMNYSPSIMASALTGKNTKTIGLLVPDISNPFYAELAKTIEDRAHENGMSVIICSTDANPEKERKYLEVLQQKQADGFLVSSTFQDDTLLDSLIEKNHPLVMLTIDDPAINVSKVSVDDFKAGFMATKSLLNQGHDNIVIIAENAYSSRMRVYGYREAHESHGVKVCEENIIFSPATIESGKQTFKTILEREDNEHPTAIFACNDLLAIGIIHAAKENGLRIPEDLSVIGFDNTILATTSVPSLTSVAQPVDEIGKKSVDLLLQEIEAGTQLKERHIFNPELIVRGTTQERESPTPKV